MKPSGETRTDYLIDAASSGCACLIVLVLKLSPTHVPVAFRAQLTSEFRLSAEFSTCSSKRIQAREKSPRVWSRLRFVWKTLATPDRLKTCEKHQEMSQTFLDVIHRITGISYLSFGPLFLSRVARMMNQYAAGSIHFLVAGLSRQLLYAVQQGEKYLSEHNPKICSCDPVLSWSYLQKVTARWEAINRTLHATLAPTRTRTFITFINRRSMLWYLPDNSLPCVLMQQVSVCSDGAKQRLASRLANGRSVVDTQLT